MIETAVIRYVSEATSVQGRAYISTASSDAPLPFVLFQLTGRDEDHLKGGTGLIYSEFQVDCYGATSLKAAQLADQVKRLINNFEGDMHGVYVTLARIENEYDGEEKQSASFLRTLTLYINHRVDS